MPRSKRTTKTVETLRHQDASRKNIPTAEYQAVMADDDRNPIRVAYERRNRDLDPQLVWRGKDEQNWSDLVVQAPPLFIQEKVQPKVLIDDLRQRSKETGDGEANLQTDLFADFNGLPSADAQTEFYQHDANWSNRMILGDSLQVMASLAEREGLRGKVQCIYIDPPYGIKFNSNFQWSTTSRKPYEDNKKVRVAGPFTVESLSPHRLLGVDENDELIDNVAEAKLGYGEKQDFAEMILDNLKTSGVQQAHKDDRISFSGIRPWPGYHVCAEGTYVEGTSDSGAEKRAGIFVGPEFGTVSRPDLVSAVREAADADFDVLVACAFNYDAHASEFNKLGRVPVLKARMNADLHMADDLKNTGKGNLFVIFGEPDITVVSGQWLVTRSGEKFANYEQVKELSGLGSLEEINRAGKEGLSTLSSVSVGGKVRHDQPSPPGRDVGGGEYRGGSRTSRDRGVSSVSGDGERLAGGNRNFPDSGAGVGDGNARADQTPAFGGENRWTDAQRTQTLTAIQKLTHADFPLALTTGHWSQVTVHGVDVFHPNTGEIRSDSADSIACWFVDTDYNEESFFVRHAYFLGANDPYKSLRTTLKAEVNQEAWETLHSDTSRPFDKPTSGRIAVKVINHLGDEVMKVFRV